ncbi:MAG: iron complex outermembrane receptor protein [Glaciecola sp.]|jgi:iron complex outermembrane receptor protein
MHFYCRQDLSSKSPTFMNESNKHFKKTMFVSRFILFTFAGILLSQNATASQAQDKENVSPESGSNSQIERIVVTANRAQSTILYTAAAVDAVDRSTLDLIDHQHINQALARISGTWISRGNGQEHLSAIRSPVLTGAGACGAFFMALDGISLRAPGFCNTNQLFDANSEQAESIEVLRGPASTLYGSNAVHGVINIRTPDAFSNASSNTNSNAINHAALRIGRDDHVKTSLGLRSQQGDSAFALFTNVTQNNGYQSQSGYDQQKLTAIYQHNGNAWNNKTVLDLANLNQETAGFVQGFEVYKDPEIRRSNPNPEAFRDAKSLRAYSSFSRDTESGAITITPYLRWNEMAFLQHYLPWKALEENSATSLGLQAQHRIVNGDFTFTSGLDTDFTRANLRETQAQDFSPSIPAGTHYDYDVNATQIGAYSQMQWQSGALQLSAGGRLEYIAYDYDNLLSDGNACASTVENCRFTRPADQNVNFTVFSPTLSALYATTNEQSVYAKISQGFRAPQATELFRLQNEQVISELDEERMDAIELGWHLYTDAINLNAAVFMQEKSNFIFQDSDRQNVSNGETRHKGIELSGLYKLNNQISLSTNLSYAKHEYTNDLTLSRTSIKGNEIDTAPEFMGTMQLAWKINSSVLAELSFQRLGNYFVNPENTAEYSGHSLWDLSFRYDYSKRLKLNMNIFNILNEDYAERADFGFGNYRYFVGQPRRIFLTATWQWAQ